MRSSEKVPSFGIIWGDETLGVPKYEYPLNFVFDNPPYRSVGIVFGRRPIQAAVVVGHAEEILRSTQGTNTILVVVEGETGVTSIDESKINWW